MDAGATYHVKDANVRRLQALQDAAGQAFTAHVARHKAEIARQHSYFKEKFSILGKNIRDIGEDTVVAPLEELVPAPAALQPDPASPDPILKRREQRAERRRLRKLRGRRTAMRDASPATPVQPRETPPDTMKKISISPQQPLTSNAAEEMKVLMEIEKFEKMRQQLKPEPAPPPPAEPIPPEAAPLSSPADVKGKVDGFSLSNIFDLSPRFRDIGNEDNET